MTGASHERITERQMAALPRAGRRTSWRIALGAGGVWALGVTIWTLFSSAIRWTDAPSMLMVATLPLICLWFARRASQARHLLERMAARQHEMATLLAELRETGVPASPTVPGTISGDGVADRLSGLADAQARSDRRLNEITGLLRAAQSVAPAAQAEAPPAPRPEPQPALDLAVPEMADAPPLSLGDFITALQFPADTEDRAGFRALRRALRDRRARQVVTSAQDVLTLMSQDGLYMDDLMPLPTPPALWRRLAAGQRGGDIAAASGAQDGDALDAATARARQDMIFRDAVHHFLRHFDQALVEIVPDATDAQIVALSETRTARAFLLLGRMAKMFD